MKKPAHRLAEASRSNLAPQSPPHPSPPPASAGPAPAGPAPGPDTLVRLWDMVLARRDAPTAASYTATLLAGHPVLPARKLAEEAAECVIDAVRRDRDGLIRESADLIYHLVVLLAGAGVAPSAVFGELAARERLATRKSPPKRRPRKAAPLATRKIP